MVSSAEPDVEELTPKLLRVSEPAVLLSPRDEPMLGSLSGFYRLLDLRCCRISRETHQEVASGEEGGHVDAAVVSNILSSTSSQLSFKLSDVPREVISPLVSASVSPQCQSIASLSRVTHSIKPKKK